MHTIPTEGKSKGLRAGLAVILFLIMVASSIGMNNAIESSIAGQDQGSKLAIMALFIVLSNVCLILVLLYRGGATEPANNSSYRVVNHV